MTFTQPVSMKVTKDQFNHLTLKLKELGYSSYTKYLEYGQHKSIDILVTNPDSKNDKYFLLFSAEKEKRNRFFLEDYNEELFLAFAAMSDQEIGIKGEWWIRVAESTKYFTQGELYRQFASKADAFYYKTYLCNNLTGNDSRKGGGICPTNTNQFRKATRAELITHMTNKKIKPIAEFTDSESIHCPTKEQYLKIIALLKLSSEFKGYWNYYKDRTVLFPSRKAFGNLDGSWFKSSNSIAYPATDYITEDKTIEKQDMPELKSGHVVELEDASRGLIVQGSDGTLVAYFSRSGDAHRVLLDVDTILKDRIKIIYSGLTKDNKAVGIGSNITSNSFVGKLIWQRPNPRVILSLKEIADKFEIEVENLQIKEYD